MDPFLFLNAPTEQIVTVQNFVSKWTLKIQGDDFIQVYALFNSGKVKLADAQKNT